MVFFAVVKEQWKHPYKTSYNNTQGSSLRNKRTQLENEEREIFQCFTVISQSTLITSYGKQTATNPQQEIT